MQSPRFLLLTVVSGLLVGCKPSAKPSEDHVSVELSWSGATAEGIKDQLPALGQKMKLAVIDDGHASLYFQEDISKVETLLASVKGKFPQAVSFSHLMKNSGLVPDAPKVTTTKYHRDFKVNRDASSKAGVSLIDLSNALKEIPEPTEEVESANILDGKFVESANGDKVPLGLLVDSKIVRVTRPLVVEHH